MLLLLICILLKQVLTKPGTSVIWQAFDYMSSGIFNVIVSSSYSGTQFSSTTSTVNYTYPIIFDSKTYENIPMMNVGIMGMQINPTVNSIYLVNTNVNTTLTGFTYMLSIDKSSSIIYLKLSYLGADTDKVNSIRLSRIGISQTYYKRFEQTSSGTGYRSTNILADRSSIYVMDMNHTNIYITHIKGFEIQVSSSDKLFTLGIKNDVLNQTHSNVTIWTTGSCQLIHAEYYTLFIDKDLIEITQEYFMDFGVISGQNNNQITNTDQLDLVSNGYIFAINFFKFNFSSTKTQGFDLAPEVKQLTKQNDYLFVNISYFSFKKRGCPPADPNYYKPQELCYQQCPKRTFLNSTYAYCTDCKLDCSVCTNTTACSQCNTTESHRKKDGKNCKCQEGYYESNQYICGQCSDGCLTCSNNTDCIICNSADGYILIGSTCGCNPGFFSYQGKCTQCKSVLLGCSSCSNNSICDSCQNSNYLYIQENFQCKCNIGFTEVDFECQLCNKFLTGCLQCESSEKCLFCDSGFLLINGICQCPNGTFLNSQTISCKKCDITCLTCTDGTSNSCTSCSQFLIKDQGSCLCKQQNYVSNGKQCVQCANLCDSLICTGSTDSSCQFCSCPCQNGYYKDVSLNQDCQSCNIDDLLSSNQMCTCPIGMYPNQTDSNNSCLICHYSCLTCSQMSDKDCTRCNNTALRTLNESSCPCNPFFMDAEDESPLCIKLVCELGYSISSQGYCEAICGDGLVAPQQQCDDSNLLDGDGCTISCKTQANWTCSGNLTTSSVCYYNQQLQLQLQSIVKNPNKNNLTYTINIHPNINSLNNVNFSQIIDLGLPNDTKLSYKYQNGVLTIQAQYFQNLQSFPSNITFKPSNSSLTTFSNTPNTELDYVIEPQNNLAADIYPDNIYKQRQYLQYACMGVVGLALLTYCLCLYSCKLIGTQMIWVIQLSFIGLIILQYTDPLYEPMRKLLFSNGYSMNFSQIQMKIPKRIQSLGYYNSLINNFNIMIALELLVCIVSVSLFISSKVVKDDALRTKLKSFSKLAIGQWMITAILLSVYQYSVSTCVLIQYPFEDGIILYLSYALAAVFAVVVLGVSVFYGLKSKQFFGQYKTFFKQTKISQNYYFIPIISRILIGVILRMFNGSIGGFAALGILGVQFIITIILRPYQQNKHNVRQILNLFVGIIVLLLYVIFGKLKIMNSSPLKLYIPFLIVGLLILVVVSNLILAILQTISNCKQQKKNQISDSKKKQQQNIKKDQAEDLAIFKEQSKKIKAEMKSKKNKKILPIFKSKPKNISPLNSQLITQRSTPISQLRPLNNKMQQFQNSLYPMDDVAHDFENIKLTPIGSFQNTENNNLENILQEQQLNRSKQIFIRQKSNNQAQRKQSNFESEQDINQK